MVQSLLGGWGVAVGAGKHTSDLLAFLHLPGLLLLLQAFISDNPFRYLYLGQFKTLAGALAAKAAAHHALYGPSGRSTAPPSKGTGSKGKGLQGGGGAADGDAPAAAGDGPAVTEAEARAMAAKLVAGKQGDMVRSVMRQHGTLGLLSKQ